MKSVSIIFVIIVVCSLIYFIVYQRVVVQEKGDIKVLHKGFIFPNIHKGGKHSLYYKRNELCSEISAVYPNLFLISPDSKYIIYINENRLAIDIKKRYEVFNIVENRVMTFPYAVYLVGLNYKIEWHDDQIILSNERQKDILTIGNKRIEIIELQ